MAEPSKAVLITGCSSGIGRATALRLARGGWTVYATARRPESIAELAEAGLRTLALDVTDEQSMQAAVGRDRARPRARSACSINNAGYSQSGAIETVPLDAVRRQFETNVFGLVRLTQLVLPKMRAQRWGKIVNVGSMGGRLTFPGRRLLPRDQARGRGDLRRAALRAARLRHRRDPARAGPDHDRVRRGRRRRSMADVERRRGRRLREVQRRPSARVTKGAYDGPMRHLGAGPSASPR